MENNEKTIAALWTIWGAIQQAKSTDAYNETLGALYNIAKEAMIRADQIKQPSEED